MNGKTLDALWTAFWILFLYRMTGVMMLIYLEQKFYQLEYMTKRWGHLYRTARCRDGVSMARTYYHMLRDKYDEGVILPLQEGIWFWLMRLLLAIPAALGLLMAHLVTTASSVVFGGSPIPMTPERFSFTESLLWPRTLVRSLRQIRLNHQEYEKCRDYVRSRIDRKNQPA